MNFEYPQGATPLDADEMEGLIPKHITLKKELDQWEQTNIHQAEQWLFKNKKDILDEKTLLDLHRKMFDKTWKWAGTFRKTNKNIGVDKSIIAMELRRLIDDVKFQIQYKSFPLEEIAVRFHHRLVFIHLFPNGNGRHSRIATDYLLKLNNLAEFTWGRANLVEANETRNQYIVALKQADNMDYKLLLEFARS